MHSDIYIHYPDFFRVIAMEYKAKVAKIEFVRRSIKLFLRANLLRALLSRPVSV